MRALDFRDGDIVVVSPQRGDGFEPFVGVVDSRFGKDIFKWVYVRRFGKPYQRPGGWYPNQCRRVARPSRTPALPIPSNIVLSDN